MNMAVIFVDQKASDRENKSAYNKYIIRTCVSDANAF